LVAASLFGPGVSAADGNLLTPPLTSRVPETPVPGPAHSIGSAANGCLTGAVALPLSGSGWETLRPERNRFWGNPALIAFIEDKAGQTAGLGRMLIGDMAQPRGGHMTFGHGSHQTGVDVDVLYRLSNHSLGDEERTTPTMDGVVGEDGNLLPERWGRNQTALLRAFATDPRVERIFVNPAIKRALCSAAGEDRDWLHVLRPWWGHDDHFHVRIHCPEGDTACVAGAPVPPGDGCGAELESWMTSGDWKSRPKPPAEPQKIHRPEMPAACREILGIAH
jgi:penicillin-insensitive murein endopeptidase